MFGNRQEKAVKKVFNHHRKKEQKLEKDAAELLRGMRAAAALVPGLDAAAAITSGRCTNKEGIWLVIMTGKKGGFGVEVSTKGSYLVYNVNGEGGWDNDRRTLKEVKSGKQAVALLTGKMIKDGCIPVQAALPVVKPAEKPFRI